MSNLHIVTGYRGEPHVTAEDHGALNAAVFGSGEYVLSSGSKFAASVVSNNQVRVLDGCIMMQGRHIRLEEGSYVDLTIENGSQDTYRNDLIVARYTKDATSGVEDCNLVVIKGTAVSSNPSDPAYTSGDIINDHALQNDMLLYRVPLVGLNVQDLVPLFSVTDASFQNFGSKQDKTDSLTAATSIADGDYFPFYDVSATANRKTLWSNIVAKIRTALFGTIKGVLKADGNGTISATNIDATPTPGSANLVTSGGVKEAIDAFKPGEGSITKDMLDSDVTAVALGGVSMKKLWSNASPTSVFPAQTVAVDWTAYDYVRVVGTVQNNFSEKFIASADVPCNVGNKGVFFDVGIDGWFHAREFELVSGGISFTTGSAAETYNKPENHDKAAIPVVIIGIKGVQ